jgi:hypothetical protein
MFGYGTSSILYFEKFKEMLMSKKISPLSWSLMSLSSWTPLLPDPAMTSGPIQPKKIGWRKN